MNKKGSLCDVCPEMKLHGRCGPRIGLQVTTVGGTSKVVKCNWYDHLMGENDES